MINWPLTSFWEEQSPMQAFPQPIPFCFRFRFYCSRSVCAPSPGGRPFQRCPFSPGEARTLHNGNGRQLCTMEMGGKNFANCLRISLFQTPHNWPILWFGFLWCWFFSLVSHCPWCPCCVHLGEPDIITLLLWPACPCGPCGQISL